MKLSTLRKNPMIKGSLIGVVIGLAYYLLVIGTNSQYSDPVVAGVSMDGLIAVTILGVVLYFDKKRDREMDELRKILRRLDKKK
ncbi:MAG: hypothetical protein KGL95_09845 [Patescibacteria group bacterium]|nr:hypothetical protein [Patescibacteria group bacterium]